MAYEINIAKRTKKHPNGEHWGRIQLPEYNEEKAEKKLDFLRELFGSDYHLSMTYWKCVGEVKSEWK